MILLSKINMSQSNITSFFAPVSKRKHAETVPVQSNKSTATTSQDSQENDTAGSSGNAAENAIGGPKLTENLPNAESLKKQKLSTKFHESWKTGRPWLTFVTDDGMFCTWCKNKTPFGRTAWNSTPCTRLGMESVKYHNKQMSIKTQ